MEVPNQEDLLLLVFSILLTIQWFRSNLSSIQFPIAFDNNCFAAYRTRITTWSGSSNTANDYTVAKNTSVVKAVTQSTVTVPYASDSYFLAIGY